MTRRPLPINESTKEDISTPPTTPLSPLPANGSNIRVMPLTENTPETPQIVEQDKSSPKPKPKPKPKF
uniref:Uncharacterized protein n=1 Tax=viral metagenome TaxID=1070528 RepID=A0A6C0F7T1_9ZZZZ